MRSVLRTRLLASVLVVSVVPFVAAAVPAQAQYQSDASFDRFHEQLGQYGDWVYSDRWGLVWQPADVPDDFRPYYSGGRWAYTRDYGWTWASDYDWGDIAFHYGRWVDDPYDGWMWIPGYSWSPGWVVWRSNRQSIGWMPMPPDDDFLGGRGDTFVGISFGGISVSWNNTSDYYGYSRWYGRDYDQRRFAANWTFVDTGHMADRDYRHVAYSRDRAAISIRQTTNITNYTIVNNYMVNRSVDVRIVERAGGRPVVPVAATAVFRHPNTVMTVDAGQRFRAREFDRAPHGNGIANSAPPPPPAVIEKLSDHVAAHHAGGMPPLAVKPGAGPAGAAAPSHIFTKSTITAPAAATQFRGQLRTGPTGLPPSGAVIAPSGAPKGLPLKPTGAPVTTTTVPGAPTGPNASHPTGGAHVNGPGGPVSGHTGTVQPDNGPAATAGPATTTNPVVKPKSDKGHLPPATGGGSTPETGNMHDRHPGQDHGATGAPSDMTGGPGAHAVGGETVPPLHPMTQPVVKPVPQPMTQPPMKPMSQPMTEPMTQPVTEPVTKPVRKPLEHQAPPTVTPVTEPVVHPQEHNVDHPVPVTHAPPPVVESGTPAEDTAAPKKKKHENKGDQNPPN